MAFSLASPSLPFSVPLRWPCGMAAFVSEMADTQVNAAPCYCLTTSMHQSSWACAADAVGFVSRSVWLLVHVLLGLFLGCENLSVSSMLSGFVCCL